MLVKSARGAFVTIKAFCMQGEDQQGFIRSAFPVSSSHKFKASSTKVGKYLLIFSVQII